MASMSPVRTPTPVTAAAAAVAAVVLASCQAAPRMPAPLQHVVLVDLADDSDIAAMKAASDAALPGIGTVKGYVCGSPVDIGRPNVSKDYDLGIIVQFESIEDYKAYLADPVHTALVEAWKPKWRKAAIFDFAP
jgi:hypothetical protein